MNETRWIPQEHVSEVFNLWHLSRTALSGQRCGRYERLVWTSNAYSDAHPEVKSLGAYKDIDALTRQ